jgi:hypothetical protein
MLRIIDMRKATSMERGFAVWDTVWDRFLSLDGEEAFDGEEDLRAHAKSYTDSMDFDVERIVSLLPSWAKSKAIEQSEQSVVMKPCWVCKGTTAIIKQHVTGCWTMRCNECKTRVTGDDYLSVMVAWNSPR